MSLRRWPIAAVLCGLMVCVAPFAAAQTERRDIDRRIDEMLKERWVRALNEEARNAGLAVNNGRLSGTPEQKTRVYTAVVRRMEDDQDLLELFTQVYVQSLIDEQVESRVPTSANATSTNPATSGLPERSGTTSLLALASDLSSLVSADKSAVSLNLNALAFVSLKNPEVYSALKVYQEHSLVRRFSGTVVFGAKIPEKEITGLSNLPDFDKILDAFSWDVKVRVLGDKDPRSARWSPLTVVRGGLLTQKSAVLLTLVGGDAPLAAAEDLAIVQSLLGAMLSTKIAEIKSRIAKSPQLSVKVAGTHLSDEAGRTDTRLARCSTWGSGRRT